VNKQRKQEKNIQAPVAAPDPVEMGAVWSAPGRAGRRGRGTMQTAQLQAGHFLLYPAPQAPARAVASAQFQWLRWMLHPSLFFSAEKNENSPWFPSLPVPINPFHLQAALPSGLGKGQR
jgi:hypothetical protein